MLTHQTSNSDRLRDGAWSGKRPPTVLLADDHGMITDGLRHMLEPDCEVVAVAIDGRAMIDAAITLRPDIVLVDITMPFLNGIDATQKLLREVPATHVIVLTMHADRAYVAEAFDAGAVGFVVKHAASDELWQAINAALAGDTYISPRVGGDGTMPARSRDLSSEDDSWFRLTSRQRQVLQLIAEGHSTKAIGIQLAVSPKTIEFHKYRIMKGLGLTSSVQLVQFALKHGLIS